METVFVTLALEVLGGLIAAGLIGTGGYALGRLDQTRRFEKRHTDAISSFSESLEKIIFERKLDPLTQGRAIVSVRDSTRDQLSNLGKLLNSDIDSLSEIIRRVDTRGTGDDSAAAAQLIKVLQYTWPAKKPQIDVAVRRVLAELGLDEKF